MRHNAIILALTVCFLSGCGLPNPYGAVRDLMNSASVSDETKAEVARELVESQEREQERNEDKEAMKPFIWLGVAFLGLGVFITFFSKTNTLGGVGLVISAILSSSWGLFAPTHAVFVGWFLGIGIVSAVAYLIAKLFIKKA